jgi:hypothetical protein
LEDLAVSMFRVKKDQICEKQSFHPEDGSNMVLQDVGIILYHYSVRTKKTMVLSNNMTKKITTYRKEWEED